jgi:hypothetical protein
MKKEILLSTDAYPWTPDMMMEIILPDPDSFLKIRETLTRIGVASRQEKTLWQSAHILHKAGRYYVVHFLELFRLDGRSSDITVDDIRRRNTITNLLADWGLCTILSTDDTITLSMDNITVIPFSKKSEWQLRTKYTMRSARPPISHGND